MTVRTLFILALMFVLGACASANRPLQLVSGAGPVYPQEARERGVEGEVAVRYDVSAAGRVVNARVVRSQPRGIFDEAALAAVRSWQFNAPIVDGEPTPARNRQSTVTFKLSNGDEYEGY